jgi:hypothetical protein
MHIQGGSNFSNFGLLACQAFSGEFKNFGVPFSP